MLNSSSLGKYKLFCLYSPVFQFFLFNKRLLHFQTNFIYTLQRHHCHRIAAVQLEACQHLSFRHMKRSVAREILLPLLFWFAVFPFFPADIPAAPSVIHLTSLLIFNRKAGRNIHALIHANVSLSPIIPGYFLFISQYCTMELHTLRTLQWPKKDGGQLLSE